MDKTLFKRLLSYLESSGGIDTNHPEVTQGLHQGTKAMGEYGMMPKTIQDLARNNPQKTELDRIIQGAAPTSVEEILESNPHKYDQYANQMIDKVLTRSNNNPEEAAMRWYAGPSSSKSRIRDIASETPSRVDKIEEFLTNNPGMSEPQTFTEKLTETQPVKEVLFNKIRNRLAGN